MKILNLYAGIGGNRKLWKINRGDEIWAVENNKEIANIYYNLFPFDKLIIGDAHEFLLNNYEQFDFIGVAHLAKVTLVLDKISVLDLEELNQNTPI